MRTANLDRNGYMVWAPGMKQSLGVTFVATATIVRVKAFIDMLLKVVDSLDVNHFERALVHRACQSSSARRTYCGKTAPRNEKKNACAANRDPTPSFGGWVKMTHRNGYRPFQRLVAATAAPKRLF